MRRNWRTASGAKTSSIATDQQTTASSGCCIGQACTAAAEGLTTRVVRALDQAGVPVNDVTMQRASLDDVFLALTGHVSAPAEDTAEDTSEDEEGSEAA